MIMTVPQFLITFTALNEHEWIVNGEDQLEALCRVLRWNGINTYTIRPVTDEDHKRLRR